MKSCPVLLAFGSCNVRRCTYNHHILFCDTCKISARNSAGFSSHVRSDRHRRTVTEGATNNPLEDSKGITIEGGLDFGIVEQAEASKGVKKTLCICSTEASSKIVLASVKLKPSIAPHTKRIASSFNVEGATGKLSPGPATVVVINFVQRSIGRYQEQVELEFEDLQMKKRFIIPRMALAVVGGRTLGEQLRAKAPYLQRRPAQREPEANAIEGVKLPALKAISYVTPMPRAEIPPGLLATLNKSSSPSSRNVQAIQRTFLPPTFKPESHGKQFKALMWVEEHRTEQDLERYDMTDSTLARNLPHY